MPYKQKKYSSLVASPSRLAAAALFAALLGGAPLLAHGHASPIDYSPRNGAVLQKTPSTVSILLSERVEERVSRMSLVPPGTTTARAVTSHVDNKNPRLFEGALENHGDGLYTILWSVGSRDDGHFTKGAFAFIVGTTSLELETNPASFSVEHRSGFLEGFAVFLELAGHALLLGLGLIITLGAPRDNKKFHLVRTIAASLSVAGVVLYMAVSALAIAGQNSLTLPSALASAVKSSAGAYALARLSFTLLGATLILRRTTHALVSLFLASTLRAAISHAAASTFFPLLGIAVNSAHVIVKEAWIGGLIVFSLTQTDWTLYQRLRKSFAMFLGIGAATGGYIIWLHLKDPANIMGTEWGKAFGALMLWSGLFLLIHLAQRFRESSASFLYAEATVGLVVLYISSILIITTPPITNQRLLISRGEHAAATLEIRTENPEELVIESPSSLRGVTPEITVYRSDSTDTQFSTPVEKIWDTGFAFSRGLLGLDGSWNIDVRWRKEGSYDTREIFNITLPGDLASGTRHADALALFAALASVFLVILGRFLYKTERGTSGPIDPSSEPPYGLLTAATLIISLLNVTIFISPFEKLCATNGHRWEVGPAVREGATIDPIARSGCGVGSGRGYFHFGDAREYAWFLRPSSPVTTITLAPEKPTTKATTTITVRIADENGGTEKNLVVANEHILSLHIIPRTEGSIRTRHPEEGTRAGTNMRQNATFSIEHKFEKPGIYTLVAEGFVRAHKFTQLITVAIAGTERVEKMSAASAIGKSGSYTVALDDSRPPVAQKNTALLFSMKKDGAPVTNLEPLDGSLLRVRVVSEDGTQFASGEGFAPGGVHSHGAPPASSGPLVVAPTIFPAPGTYRLFATFKHGGALHTVQFTSRVSP